MSIKTDFLKKLGFGSHSELETRNPKPESASDPAQLETRNPEPETDPHPAQPGTFSSQPETQNAKPETPQLEPGSSGRSPNGKVARLPKAIRDQVCEMLDDGTPMESIIRKLTELGHPGFNHTNLINWKKRGYRTWCTEAERRERAKIRADAAIDAIRETGGSDDLCKAAEIYAATEFYEMLLEPEEETRDRETALERARRIAYAAKTLSSVMAERTRRSRLSLDEQRYRDQLAGLLVAMKNRKPGEKASEEERQAIFDLVDTMFGVKRKKKRKTDEPLPPASVENATLRDETLSPLNQLQTEPETSEGAQPIPGDDEPAEFSQAEAEFGQAHDTSGAEKRAEPETLHHSSPFSPLPHVQSDSALDALHSALPTPILGSPYPPRRILQPPKTIPILNYNGLVTAWTAVDQSETTPGTPFKSRRGQIVCLFDQHSRPPGMTDSDPVRGQPHQIPILNREGRIIGWAPEPDGRRRILPSSTSTH